MEDKKPNNLPAFPDLVNILKGDNFHQQIRQSGMTLLDYFAGKALQGMLSNPRVNAADDDVIISACYSLAESMLKERMKYEQ